ncbi:MAG TPA: TonB-dependent receptor, partial [Vicinamibacterales bacterium]|nr:TonB-dependent receptor [Vicinamibacterales bacterium]
MRAALVLLLVGSCALPLAAQGGGDDPVYAGRPLVEVLQDLNRLGLRIVFSTSLVPATLRVSSEPAGTPRDILDQVLRPHGLHARSGAQGVLIVARAPKRRDEAVPSRPAPAARPAGTEQPVSTTSISGQVHDESQAPIRISEVTLVSSRHPIVDVQNAAVGTTFAGAMLRDIPNQRDLFALLAQTPGIAMPRPDVGGNTAGTQSTYRAYGLWGQSITTVDGVNITSGADDVGAYIDYGALAEAKVVAAGNSAEVPVAGAAVATVIKTGSNTPHGEVYADFKPGGHQPFDRAEHYAKYRDINAQLGGAFIKDRLWYFTSFRDQYTALTTAMFDRPPHEGGIQGQPFTTQTTDYTIKLNYQVSVESALTFMTQLGKKYQPYRFGSGVYAAQYVVESTARQDSRSHIGKIDYMRVIGNRATLDASINVYGNHFPLTTHTDKTPIIDDVTFARRGAYNMPGLSRDARRHYNTNLSLYADRHDIKIGYMYQHYAPRLTAYGAPGPAGTTGHFFLITTNGVPTSFWTDNGPVASANTLDNHALFFQDRFQVTPKLTLNVGVRYDRYHSSYPEQRFGANG